MPLQVSGVGGLKLEGHGIGLELLNSTSVVKRSATWVLCPQAAHRDNNGFLKKQLSRVVVYAQIYCIRVCRQTYCERRKFKLL